MPHLNDRDQEVLEKAQGLYPLSLGRNILTRIHDTKLSRHLASLEFRNQHQRSDSTAVFAAADGSSVHRVPGPVLILKVNQSNKFHKVCLNGARILMDEVALSDNDQISLHGDKYKYLVHLVEIQLVEVPHDAEPDFAVASNANAATLASGSFAVGNASGTSGDGADSNVNISFQTVATNEAEACCSSRTSTPSNSQDTFPEPIETSQSSQDGGENKTGTGTGTRKRKCSEMETSAIDKIQETARQHILDDVTCTICMEILVHTHVANPCGHIFCKSCIERIPSVQRKRYMTKSCPTCRKEITSLSWARSYDNIIWNMVLMGEIFGEGMHGEEDLNQFLSRCGRNVSDLTKDEKSSIYQKCKKSKHKQGTDCDSPFGLKLGGSFGSSVNSDGNGDDDGSIAMITIGRNRGSNIPFSSSAASRLFGDLRFGMPPQLNFAHAPLPRGNEDPDGPAGTTEDPICLDD